MPTFDELYKYHSFSKAPAAAGLTTGQSVNKAGHTVTAKDVWAYEIPYMFSVDKLADLASKSPKLNDLAWAGAEKKYYQFNGTSWDNITSTISSTVLKNADGKDVLKFHKGELKDLDNTNNAGVTSNGQAYRFFIEGKPVQRWVAATDCIDETGFPSLGYNVIVIKDKSSTLLDGTDFFADYYGGTIFFASGQNASTKFEISCFEYVGKCVSEELGGFDKFYDNRGENVTPDDLWGRVVTTDKEEKSVSVKHNLLTSLVSTSEWRAKVDNVVDDKVYDAEGTFISFAETDKIADGANMFNASPLTSFSGRFDSLYSGHKMFKNSNISSYNGHLNELLYSPEMFKGTDITSFNETLPALTYGKSMFEDTASLKTVTANSSYLIIGEKMFKNSAIESFSGSLPYLYVGTEMFMDTNLRDINTKFSALVTGIDMFTNTNLTLKSIETISKSLPRLNYLVRNEDETVKYGLEDGMVYYYIKYAWNSTAKKIIGEHIPYKIPANIIGELTITWKDPDSLTHDEKLIAIHEYFRWMQLNGWTIITNISDKEIDDTTDDSIWVRGYEVQESYATHATSEGTPVKLVSSPYVYPGLNMFSKDTLNTWKQYSSLSAAVNALNLIPLN